MLEDLGMREVLHQNFYDFFHEHRHNPEDVRLMFNMKAFDRKTVRMHACNNYTTPTITYISFQGTMSTAEWEVIGLYLVFVFEKIS